jgi:U6 snRNA-associated Sm-like protein LSm7
MDNRGGRGNFRGGPGGGRGGGGRGDHRGGARGGHQGQQGQQERKPREAILDLSKFKDKAITVKFNGGREGGVSRERLLEM